MTAKERERAFLIGAPLAIVPALCVLSVIVFLVIFPHVEHGWTLAAIVLPLCALAGSFGLGKLALGAVEKPWGIFNALSFGALLVLLVIAGYGIVPGAGGGEAVDVERTPLSAQRPRRPPALEFVQVTLTVEIPFA